MPKTLKEPQAGFSLIIIIVFIATVLLAGGGFLFLSKNKGIFSKTASNKGGVDIAAVVDQVKGTPYSELESALDKTGQVKSAYLEFDMKDTAMVTVNSQGITKTIVGLVSGYLTGSTDGKSSKVDMRISSPDNPNTSINISYIILESGDTYLKGPATSGKWLKSTKQESKKRNEASPTDASLYGFQIFSTIFSENKALFKAINKDTVTKLPDEVKEGKKLNKYAVDISTPEFLIAQAQDEEFTDKDKSDAKIILQDAIMKATFVVDSATNYVVSINVEAKHLTQIPTPESQNLGVSTTHDLDLNANMSRFDVPADVTPPAPSEVISTI